MYVSHVLGYIFCCLCIIYCLVGMVRAVMHMDIGVLEINQPRAALFACFKEHFVAPTSTYLPCLPTSLVQKRTGETGSELERGVVCACCQITCALLYSSTCTCNAFSVKICRLYLQTS